MSDFRFVCPACGWDSAAPIAGVTPSADPADLLNRVQDHINDCFSAQDPANKSSSTSPTPSSLVSSLVAPKPLKAGLLIVALLGALILGNMTHELGHVIYCTANNGIVTTDSFTYTECTWTPADPRLIPILYWIGGLFAAMVGIILIVIARKWLAKHSEFMVALIALVITHLANAVLEGTATEFYLTNWEWLGTAVYIFGITIALVTVLRDRIKFKQQQTQLRKMQKQAENRYFESLKHEAKKELMPDHAKKVAAEEVKRDYPIDPSQKPSLLNKMLQGMKKSLDEDIERMRRRGQSQGRGRGLDLGFNMQDSFSMGGGSNRPRGCDAMVRGGYCNRAPYAQEGGQLYCRKHWKQYRDSSGLRSTRTRHGINDIITFDPSKAGDDFKRAWNKDKDKFQ